MAGRKILDFLQENVVLITGMSIVVATHWGWSQLQQTDLVPEDKRKDLPIIIGYKYLKNNMAEKFNTWREGAAPKIAIEKKN